MCCLTLTLVVFESELKNSAADETGCLTLTLVVFEYNTIKQYKNRLIKFNLNIGCI